MHLCGIWKPLLASLFITASKLVAAAPRLALPINSQVPPVVFVSQPYNFTFSASTFVSDAPQISYEITDGPKWLNLDSASRQFSGIPHDTDVGTQTFQLVASDPSGHTSTSVTFIVASSPNLSLAEPILPQLERSGPTSSPNSLLAHPQESFSLSFDKNTFSGITPVTRYYAICADSTPLPSWIQFDESERLFLGTTPALVSSLAGPQSYALRLVATDVPGFTEAAVDFNLVISRRVLSFSTAFQNISISSGVRFQTSSLLPLLTLDGEPIANNQIASVDANVPTWIKFDKDDLSLTGTPDKTTNATITIAATDIFGDTANAMIVLECDDENVLQLGTLATLNVPAGDNFSYTLYTPAFSPSTRVSAALGVAASWLNFDPRSWTLSGQVPQDSSLQTLNISITFENATTTESGEVILRLEPNSGTSASTSTLVAKTQTIPQASTTSTATVPKMSPSSSGASNRHVQHIILTIVFVVVGVCGILLLIFWCLRRRKRKQRESSKTSVEASNGDEEGLRRESPTQILPFNNIPPTLVAQRFIPPRPPRVDLAWSNDSIRQSKQRLSASIRPGPLSQHRMSQIDIDEREPPSRNEHSADPEGSLISSSQPVTPDINGLPVRPAPAVLIKPSTADRQSQKRSSSRVSRQSILPPLVGLPDRRSGAGHGGGVLLRPADTTPSRLSWRNSWTTNGSTDPRRTTMVLESFPAPPGGESEPARSPSRANRPIPLLHVVSEDSDESMSFEAQRQKWHTERARARLEGASRFSNAGSARMTDSPRTMWRVRSDLTADSHDLSDPIKRPSVAGSPSREHSWSKWSGIGPAAQNSARVRNASGSAIENGTMLRSKPSIASSGQFESVASSESQWEDEENMVLEEVGQGNRRWQTDSSSQASPRLPFSPVPASRENFDNQSTNTIAGQSSRVADRRKHVSVEAGGLQRSYGSQRGSFRFI